VSESALQRASEHVWWFTPDGRTDRPSLGAVCGTRGTVLLEAGASPAHVQAFLDALAGHGVPAPLACVLTHWHWDHAFGAQALTAPIVAHRLTGSALAVQASYGWSDAALDERVEHGLEIAFVRDMLRLEWPDRSGLRVVVPHLTFTDRMELDLGDVRCRVEHVGGDHADDACVAWVPEDKLVFLGDALYQALYAPVEHYTPARLVPLVDRIAALGADLSIEGHGDTARDRAALAVELASLRGAALSAQELGERALDHTRDEGEREVVSLLLAGLELHGPDARHA